MIHLFDAWTKATLILALSVRYFMFKLFNKVSAIKMKYFDKYIVPLYMGIKIIV